MQDLMAYTLSKKRIKEMENKIDTLEKLLDAPYLSLNVLDCIENSISEFKDKINKEINHAL